MAQQPNLACNSAKMRLLPVRATFSVMCVFVPFGSDPSLTTLFYQPNAQLGGLIPITHLKQHFNVSNLYVIRKLRLVVFPWRHKPWTRKMRRSETGMGEFQPPREDLNAPDL